MAELHQRILNAVDIPPEPHGRPRQGEGIPVTVRILWEHDGEEHIETLALDWTNTAVRVRLHDLRHQVKAVWVAPGDVRRR